MDLQRIERLLCRTGSTDPVAGTSPVEPFRSLFAVILKVPGHYRDKICEGFMLCSCNIFCYLIILVKLEALSQETDRSWRGRHVTEVAGHSVKHRQVQ